MVLVLLKEQVRVLLEHQKKLNTRIRLSNAQRIRVAAKAKKLRRTMLEKYTLLFTADTVLGWYNKLIAQKYTPVRRRCVQPTDCC